MNKTIPLSSLSQQKHLILTLPIIATAISAMILSSSTIFASTDVIDQVSLTVPIACTMSGTGTTHTATLNSGTYSGASDSEYENGIGKTTLTAICNDDNGFSIYAIGYANNEYGTTTLIGQNTNGTIPTKAYESGDTTSNWSMKLTKVTNTSESYNPQNLTLTTSYDTWHAVPSEYTKVAEYHANTGSSTTDTTLGVKLETTYAAYISSDQPADTYTGQVKYTMVHPYDAATPIVPTTIEDAYSQAGKTKLNGYYKIQDMTASICSSVNQYSGDGMAEVIDERDNNIYHIAKLADENCWMLDNLALDPTDSTTAQSMNESNTNASAEAINNLLHGGSSTAGWGNTAVVDADSGFTSSTAPMINNANKERLVASFGPASTNGRAKVGIYYNYCAASVSTYCYGYGQNVDVPGTIIDAPQDICPANWRMPTGGNTGEYYALAQKYGGTATLTNSLQYNLSTPFSGRYYASSVRDSGDAGNGWWWSSTYFSDYKMFNLGVSPTNVAKDYAYDRDNGLSMRCIASE